MLAPLPYDETARLEALRAYQILDTPPEQAFERIVKLASQILDVPISTVSFVDRDRQWFKAIVGLPISETTRELSFCAHAILEPDVMVIPDAAADPRFADNALVTGDPKIRFYAGAPLQAADGQSLGTLCVIDRQPRDFDERQRGILRDLAALVVDELDLRTEIAARQKAEALLLEKHRALQEANDSVERRVEERTLELTLTNKALQAEMHLRAQADNERRDSEHRFRQLFNQASEAAIVHDVDGWLVDVNVAACALLGYSREECLRLNVRDFVLDPIPAGGMPFWRELAVGSTEIFECRDRRKDGSVLLVEVHATVLATPQGRRLLALVRDVTEIRRNEELLRARARAQEAVAHLGSHALGGGGVEDLLREAVVLVGQGLGVDMCWVYEHLPEQGAFVVRASLLSGDQVVGAVVADDHIHSLAGHVLHTKQPAVVEDVATETRFEIPASLPALGVQSALCVLIGGPNPDDLRFGLLGVGHRGLLGVGHRDRRAFSDDDVFFVQSVANILATAIVRRRNEDDLRAVEARYQRIAANTPGVVYQYLRRADGTVAVPFISESCRTLYGVEAAEIQRHPQIMVDCVHPDDRPGLESAIHISKSTLTPMHWQGRHLLPGGEVRWMRIDSRPEQLPDGGVICDGIIIDITGQKQRKLALRQSEERFRLAIVHSPFPIMLHTDDGEVMQVNDAWTHITGYMSEELATMDDWIERAYPAEADRAGIRRHFADLFNHIGAMACPGQCIRCADGSDRVWDITCANLDRLPDGRWLHITTAVDVTERDENEDALRAAKEEAERANRAKSVFLSRMSHELRTPLNAILGFGQLLELSTLEQQDALSLSYILKGGRHLLGLIDEVLDLSRAETGELHLVLGLVNLAKLAGECVGLVTRLAQARGITCEVKIPRQAALWVDEQRLRQMLLNLISNAIKYNRLGGKVVLSSKKMPSGQMRIKVTDTGPGISASGIKRLFVPFERLEQEFGEVEGTGLGLVVSQRIAEAMGGSLGVESEVGKGSTFWLELPLSANRSSSSPVTLAPIKAPTRAAATPLDATLLYIEDNISNLQVVKALLANSRPHWKFLAAQDGREGLDQARQFVPDLILLDLQLPGMKGDAVLAELRHDPLTRGIPVVLLSADATAHSRDRLLESGADEYISKPFKLDSLLDLLDRTLLKAAVDQQN